MKTSADILLVNVPRYKRDFRDSRVQPPLSLAYLAAYLIKRGLRCEIIDAYSMDMDLAALSQAVVDTGTPYLGITTVTEDRFNAIELVRRVKAARPETVVIAGGPHFGYSAEDTLLNLPSIDFVISGEGEAPLLALLQAHGSGAGEGAYAHIPGLGFRSADGRLQVNPPGHSFIDFNDLKPAWHLFDLNRYQGGLCLENRTRAIGVISSRGCFNQCVFCANSLNRRVRYKDPLVFVDEIEELVQRYGFEGLNIQDDSFTSKPDHVRAICEEILRRGLRFRWYCSLRINETREEILRLMKRAGCIGLGFGIESGSNRILGMVNKRITTDRIYEKVRLAVNVGFEHIGMFVMTSLPGESRETFEQSQRFLNRLYALAYPDWCRQPVLGSVTHIYPGTALERLARESGSLTADFSWNRPYRNPKAGIFGTNPCMPYYENRDFPLEQIHRYIHELYENPTLYIC